jgi:hypothetical protein
MGKQQRKFAKVVLVVREGVGEKLTGASLSTLTALENLPKKKKKKAAARGHKIEGGAAHQHEKSNMISPAAAFSIVAFKEGIKLSSWVGLGETVIQMCDLNMQQFKFLVG